MFEIDFPWDSRIHCPRCGINNIPSVNDMERHGQQDIEKMIKDCVHLKYHGSWDEDERGSLGVEDGSGGSASGIASSSCIGSSSASSEDTESGRITMLPDASLPYLGTY